MSSGGDGGHAEGDFDLNIAPIVDCFTVLIAYLLVTMSFISLSIFDVGVAATGDPTQAVAQDTPPEFPLTLSITLAQAGKIDVHLTGGLGHLDQSLTIDSPNGAANGAYDTESLKTKLDQIIQTFPELKEANVSAENTIRYKAIVQVIEATKTKLPKVFLASS